MKTFATVILVGSALLPMVVNAAPSEGRIYAQCKLEAKQAFGESARVWLKRIRGVKAQIVVAPKGEKRRTVLCSYSATGVAQLAQRDGSPIAILSKVD